MLDHETYCKIRDCHEREHLTDRADGTRARAASANGVEVAQGRPVPATAIAAAPAGSIPSRRRWCAGSMRTRTACSRSSSACAKSASTAIDAFWVAVPARRPPLALVSYFFAMESAARGPHCRSSNLSVYYKDCKIGDLHAYLSQPERSRSNMRRTSVGISRHQFCFASVILGYRVTLPVVTTK